MSPIRRIAGSYKRIASILIDAERLLELLQTEPSVADAEEPQELSSGPHEIEFKDVEFEYRNGQTILKGISFIAKTGQKIAFVGKSGGGKSTIFNLIYRFYDVINGSIRIDGQEIRSIKKHQLRKAIGMVPQAPSLFNWSIMDNLLYSCDGATEQQVHEACRAAAIHDTIMEFPEGYNTLVGEKASKLSGGQLQRISFAQVLLKNPSILLLDEATSSLDSGTEADIQKCFEKLGKDKITFVVAYRLSTIIDADLILVLDGGKVIERGTHKELLKKGERYYKLWTTQTGTSVRKCTCLN